MTKVGRNSIRLRMFVEGFFVGAAGAAFRRGSAQRDVAFGPIVKSVVTARYSSWALGAETRKLKVASKWNKDYMFVLNFDA